jgi:hypothetical protein
MPRYQMTKQEWIDFEAAFELMRAIATGDKMRARELRRALAGGAEGQAR